MKQRTLRASCTFSGHGLHTGVPVVMEVLPAEADTGILFFRTDRDDAPVRACAEAIGATDRSTTLTENGISVVTVEHLLSALRGMGIDNARIRLNAPELPILDGSALPYVEAFAAAGTVTQAAEREYFTLRTAFEYADGNGSFLKITPHDRLEISVTIHYDHPVVLQHQHASFSQEEDYAEAIAPCRTFCLFSEVEALVSRNLIRGGALGNAVVVMDREPDPGLVERLCTLFSIPALEPSRNGYLNNMALRYPNECARHKLLDLLGDLALAGKPLLGRIEACRPGHRFNTDAVRRLVSEPSLQRKT